MDYKQLAQTALEMTKSLQMNGTANDIEQYYTNVLNPVREWLSNIVSGELCVCDKSSCEESECCTQEWSARSDCPPSKPETVYKKQED